MEETNPRVYVLCLSVAYDNLAPVSRESQVLLDEPSGPSYTAFRE